MLASFLVYLKPHSVARIGSHAGRSLHGLLMNLVGQANPQLADELHGPMRAKPFTVSTLLGRFGRNGSHKLAVPEETYRNAGMAGLARVRNHLIPGASSALVKSMMGRQGAVTEASASVLQMKMVCPSWAWAR